MKAPVDFSKARFNMIEGQVRPNKVVDQRIVDAMSTLPRELFVPKAQQALAYVDEDLPIGKDRFLMEPMVIARLLQAADIAASDLMLVVGAGSGYEAALASNLAATVLAVEADQALVTQAAARAAELNLDTLIVQQGTPEAGVPANGPYDVILVNGAMGALPPALGEQLADGGRIVGVLRAAGQPGVATLWTKMHGRVVARPLFDANTPYVPDLAPKPAFEF